MRHGIAGKKIGRNSQWRKSTVRDIAKATLVRQRVCTTLTKAKEARKLVDKLITLGKKGELAHKRKAFAILCDHKLVSKLFSQTAGRFRSRVGGYTRIIPLMNRRGDNAQLAFLELTEKEQIIVSKTKSKATSKTKEAIIPDAEQKVAAEQEKKQQKDSDQEKPVKGKVATKVHPKEDVPGKAKDKSGKNIVGGIKKMFNRRKSS